MIETNVVMEQRREDQPSSARGPKKRIERVVPVLDFGGVESLLKVQASEHARGRFELSVCTFWQAGRAATEIRSSGVRVTNLGVDPRVRNPGATLALIRHLRRTRPDLVHATVPEANTHSAIASLLTGIPCVVDDAGMPGRRLMGRLFSSVLHQSVAGIVSVSSALRDYLVAKERAPRWKMRVIPTCAEWASFDRPKTGYDTGDEIRVVCVGRLAPVKNHEVLIRTARRLVDRGNRVRIDIAGDGPHRGALEALVREEGVAPYVRLLGFHEDRAGLLRGADIYAIPSWSEGCSLSLIEAMAAGLPIVASNVAGNLEVLGDELRDWTAPPDSVEAWEALLARMIEVGPARRRSLGELGRGIARDRFSPSSYVHALESLYDDILRPRGQPN